LGNEEFVIKLEQLTGRMFRKKKPGPQRVGEKNEIMFTIKYGVPGIPGILKCNNAMSVPLIAHPQYRD